MTAVVKFQLNPLANSFIPISRQNIFQNKKNVQHSLDSENKIKTTGDENLNKNLKRQSENKKSNHPAITLDSTENFIWSDIIFFGKVTSMFNILKNYNFIGKKPAWIATNSQLPMLQECQRDNDRLLKKSNIDLIETLKVTKGDECNCPPMFGWILPLEFIGNPFNFNFQCSKKYPHTSSSTKKSDIDSLDKKINDLTLDQCYSEIRDILTDVYETISMHSEPTTNLDEKWKMQDFPELSDCEVDNEDGNESKRLGSDSISGDENKLELVDDGCHPLLQSVFTKEEDENELVKKVEKILEKSLSSLPESLGSATLGPGAICDPPCSVWCEFMPSAAKDTFKKYIQRSGNSRNFNKVCHKRLSMVHKPLYKRSLSADDAPIFGQFIQGINQTSAFESKDMLREKYPPNCLNIHSFNTRMNGKKSLSCDLTDRRLFEDSNAESSMWGKFDGEDSLWQPLPECMPINTHQKTIGHKRGR